jgi:hypothetical protein
MTLLEHTNLGPDLAPLDDLIQQRFWTGTSHHAPEIYEVNCSGFEMNEADLQPDSELARRMRATYDSVGLVVLRNTGLIDLATMREFAKIVLGPEMITKVAPIREAGSKATCTRSVRRSWPASPTTTRWPMSARARD